MSEPEPFISLGAFYYIDFVIYLFYKEQEKPAREKPPVPGLTDTSHRHQFRGCRASKLVHHLIGLTTICSAGGSSTKAKWSRTKQMRLVHIALSFSPSR